MGSVAPTYLTEMTIKLNKLTIKHPLTILKCPKFKLSAKFACDLSTTLDPNIGIIIQGKGIGGGGV